MNKRFRKIRGIIRKAIVEDDCFGLTKDRSRIIVQVQFDFPRSQDKVNAFMDWLKRQEDANIIETIRIPQIGRPTEQAWTDVYIRDSYKRGVIRARYELKNAGYDIPSLQETGGIEASMSGPFHADRVGLLYTRTFNGLKGITDAMDNQISQVLAQGLADGDNPRLLAKKLTSTISGPFGDLGITDTLGRFIPAERRAQTLARTEVIRAHHQATIQEYKNWAAERVKVKAEWVTAGYNVCPECAALEGQVFKLTEIENMIPVHPNCRCVAIPLDVTKEYRE
jgi:SPP1 gp7 family putative phage head morphogenesis protein